MDRPPEGRATRAQASRTAPAAARLFFALWPDAPARAALADWSADLHRTCGGRRVRDGQLHVTLAFLGDVPVARLLELRALAASLGGAGFTLRFDGPGHWPRKRLVWAAPVAIPDHLAALARTLAAALPAAGFRVEDRPYFPHVTLLRDAACRGFPEVKGFEWKVRDFVLVESRRQSTGACYQVIGQWPLAGRSGTDVADY